MDRCGRCRDETSSHDAITMASHACVRKTAQVTGGAITGAMGWAEADVTGQAREMRA